MSTNLYWEPAHRKKRQVGGLQLKNIIYDTLTGSPVVLNTNTLGYLRGLGDAEVDGANELIEAIEKHGEIVLTLED